MKTRWNDSQPSRKLAYSFLLVLLIVPVYMGGCFLVLKSQPYEDPDRVVRILKVAPPSKEVPVTGIEFLEWRNQSKDLSPIAAYISGSINLSDEAESERAQYVLVSADFFSLLGISPILGRTFIPDDYRPGKDNVMISSFAFWQRRFGADPSVIGKTVNIGHASYTVVGVMPTDFQFTDKVEFWVPLTFDDDSLRKSIGLSVMARLKPGITIDQAQAEISNIESSLIKKHPETNNGQIVKVASLLDAKRLYERAIKIELHRTIKSLKNQ